MTAFDMGPLRDYSTCWQICQTTSGCVGIVFDHGAGLLMTLTRLSRFYFEEVALENSRKIIFTKNCFFELHLSKV